MAEASECRPEGRCHRVAAVILNYRTPGLTIQALDAALEAIDSTRDVVVLVDNASADGSAERLRKAVSERAPACARVVETKRNDGFAAGNNAGIRAADAEAYLLLNSDTMLRPGAVTRLWETLDAEPGLGLVGPRLEWPDGTPQVSCFRDHTPWGELVEAAATGPVTRLLAAWEVPLPVREEGFAPDWLSFAAVLIRRSALEQVGPISEEFFMYYEDADYGRRAREAGWRLWYEPRARVVHLRGRTSPVKSLRAARQRRPAYYYASRNRYYRRALGPLGPLLANSMWTLGWLIARLRDAIGRRPRHTVAGELSAVWTG